MIRCDLCPAHGGKPVMVDALDMLDHLQNEHPEHGQNDTTPAPHANPAAAFAAALQSMTPTVAEVVRNLHHVVNDKPPTRDDLTLVN